MILDRLFINVLMVAAASNIVIFLISQHFNTFFFSIDVSKVSIAQL